jgi:nitrogen fixation protein NifT
MKVMIRRSSEGVLSAYVAKKDLEEPIVAMDHPHLWGGCITLANGWRLELPALAADTALPITVEARRLSEGAIAPSLARAPADVQDAQMPRRPGMAESGLDPIGEGENGTSMSLAPRLDPIGE